MKKRKRKIIIDPDTEALFSSCYGGIRPIPDSHVFGKTTLMTDCALAYYGSLKRSVICFHDRSCVPRFCADYLVFIRGAEISTILAWDGNSFVDENGNCYSVDYWATLPERPEV